MRLHPLLLLLATVAAVLCAAACQREIDIDYRDAEPRVVIEAMLTNEKAEVVITRTRPMADSVKGRCLPGATVVIEADDGRSDRLTFAPEAGCYRSEHGFVAQSGHTYRMHVEMDGRVYEAEGTMHERPAIERTWFQWVKVAGQRLLVYSAEAIDADPAALNYYKFRMSNGAEVYRWNVIDDRNAPGGALNIDILCTSDKMNDEKYQYGNFGKRLIQEGDTITLELMTIDRPAYLYFQSMVMSQITNTNPVTNITGGCEGCFTVAAVAHADTVFFSKEHVVKAQ